MVNKIKIYLCFLFLFSIPVHASLEDQINTPNAIAAPRTNRLIYYTMNAESATLIQINNGEFKLFLNHPYDNVNYNRRDLNKQNGLIKTTDFIKLWKKQKNINVQADLTGVQINNKAFGHTQFYATVFLKNPIYRDKALIFELIPIKPPIKMQSDRSDLKNATLYINGCDLLDCKKLTNTPQS